MDIVGACVAFVHVSEQRSFTAGAAAAGVPQPVASRRVAALEKRLGGRLFDRSTRRGDLTPFGRALLPAARRLVGVAEALDDAAEQALRAPLRVAVPDICSTRGLAQLQLEAEEQGIHLEPQPASRVKRAELLRTQDVRAALIAVPRDGATWHVPFGLAAAVDPEVEVLGVQTVSPWRGAWQAARRVGLPPEDDGPHIRHRMDRARGT